MSPAGRPAIGKPITFRVDISTRQWLDGIAKEQGVKIAEVLRAIIERERLRGEST